MELSSEEESRLWELYVVSTMSRGLIPSMSDYLVWKEENEN